MSGSPASPGGSNEGGGFLSGLISRAARSVIGSALNSANGTFGSTDTTDNAFHGVIEYSGKHTKNEIASIYPVTLRAGELILHGPRKENEAPPSSPSYLVYNIILHATNSTASSERMFSIFRTDSEAEATRVFVIYKQIFPDLLKASSNYLVKQTLEKIVKISKKNESYQAVHVAAALGLVEQLRSPILRERFSEQEGNRLHTPLQVACLYGKIDSVKAICEDLQQLNLVYDYTDTNGNSIVHLAANCKDKAVGAAVLKLLKDKLLHQNGPEQENMNKALLELFMKLNKEGYTPLHLACINSNKEAVEELISTFKNSSTFNTPSTYLDVKSPATGSTPLHFATSDPCLLSHLIASGSDPNITDNEGRSPLHKAVLQNSLKSTLHLLSNSGYPNFTAAFDTYIDATPLHLAASICAIDCLKALIVFGADMNVRDGKGQTPRHIIASVYSGSTSTKNDTLFVLAAAGAKRCPVGMEGCSEGCKDGGKYNGKKPANWRINKDGTSAGTLASSDGHEGILREAMRALSIVQESLDKGTQSEMMPDGDNGPVIGGRLLALDGGGIRGLVLTQILFYMEKEFGNIDGGGAPIISYFDWVAGTSTGGILALALACGKSVLETQSLYIKMKDKVFTGDRPYSAAPLEEFLKKEFGPDKKMSSIQKPKVMIMTSLANKRPADLYIFRNYISPSTLVGEPEEHSQFPDDTYVWETAKVAGAAPSYFTLDNEVFIDGGLTSNNPTLDALSELIQFKAVMMGSQQPARSNDTGWKLPSLVLSLGTGSPPREETSATNLDIAWPTGLIHAIRNVPKLMQVINLLVDQATQTEGQVVERASSWCASIGVPYFRFSPEMGEHVALDETRDEILVHLMWETWCYMEGNRSAIREIFQRLRNLDIGHNNNGELAVPVNSSDTSQGMSPERMDTR